MFGSSGFQSAECKTSAMSVSSSGVDSSDLELDTEAHSPSPRESHGYPDWKGCCSRDSLSDLEDILDSSNRLVATLLEQSHERQLSAENF